MEACQQGAIESCETTPEGAYCPIARKLIKHCNKAHHSRGGNRSSPCVFNQITVRKATRMHYFVIFSPLKFSLGEHTSQ